MQGFSVFIWKNYRCSYENSKKNHRQEHTKAIEQVVIKPWLLDLMANQKLTSTNAAHSLTSQKSLLMTTLLANECEGRSLPKANGHL